VRIVNGLSFLEPVFSALDLDPFPRCLLLDAMEVSQLHTAAVPPDVPLLIAQMYSSLVAAEVKMTLNSIYPDHHPVILVHAAGTKKEAVERVPLYEIDRSRKTGLLTSLFVPPLAEGSSFESFQEMVAHLRAPDGCPWDREQTHLSLRPHLMEEAYETLAAFDAQDPGKMQEELGDLLLQIVLNVQIASEAGDFNMADVVKGIYDKILRRHPHVFGELEIAGVDGVLKNWEKLKAAERQENGEEKGLLGGVPLALPALTQAQEFQDRAARVGFDWPEVSGVLDKIAEEINELKLVETDSEFEAELGDLLFALVNYARWKKLDAESCMRAANLRFRERFMYIEQVARKKGKGLADMTLGEMELHWQAAKRLKKGLQ
jgi:tetrapyrrole methylase family protein/MazG family protein